MKKFLKIIAIVLAILAVVVIVFMVKSHFDSLMPYLDEDYYTSILSKVIEVEAPLPACLSSLPATIKPQEDSRLKYGS